jgi:hypothetical protein
MPKSSFLRWISGAQAWRHGLTYAFYVPEELSNIRELLSAGKLQDAVAELWKLSLLGSNSAAALLEYMCLRDRTLCGIDRPAVDGLCRESANRLNAFAQYILAWCEYEKGNRKQFAQLLNQSARQRFPPAMGDLGRLFSAVPKGTRKQRMLARRFFQLAIRSGHLISIALFLNECKRGAFGRILRVLGVVLHPVSVIILIYPVTRISPFSISVFTYPVGLTRPLFQAR